MHSSISAHNKVIQTKQKRKQSAKCKVFKTVATVFTVLHLCVYIYECLFRCSTLAHWKRMELAICTRIRDVQI